jgi:hypothetical protein
MNDVSKSALMLHKLGAFGLVVPLCIVLAKNEHYYHIVIYAYCTHHWKRPKCTACGAYPLRSEYSNSATCHCFRILSEQNDIFYVSSDKFLTPSDH